MKNIFVFLVLIISCKALPQSNCSQYTIRPLRTYTHIPEDQCYYKKDTNNELQSFEGTWKGVWNGKIIFLTFSKRNNIYDEDFHYNLDYLVGKFKTLDNNGNILFDNNQLSDNNAKIFGIGFQNVTNKYIMSYVDKDLCGITGTIEIAFANRSKTQLNFSLHQDSQVIDSDCYFHGWPQADRPQPLPKMDITLMKQ